MIAISYSTTHKPMADISGSWKDFEILRQIILTFLESKTEKILIEFDKNANLEGREFVLENLEINQKSQAVKVSVLENKTLKITDSKENLDIFAAWLEFEEDTTSGYHSHYEYFEGNEYINSESIPLIIRLK